MQVENRNTNDVRRVLIAMVLDRYVIAKVSAIASARKTEEGLFNSPWANLVAGWAIKHYEKYGEPIGKHIQVRFESWSGKGQRDPDTIKAVERLLSGLSKESSTSSLKSSEFLVDMAEALFQRVALERMARQVLAHVEVGNVEKAKAVYQSWAMPVATVDITDPFTLTAEDYEDIITANSNDVLLEYEQALNTFYQDTFSRDSFVAYLGPEKRGKSFHLMDVVVRGVQQNRRVAYFEVGDMSKRQVLRRMASRITGKPWKPGEFKLPRAIHTEDGSYEIECDTVNLEPMSGAEVARAFSRLKKKAGLQDNLLRLSCHPNSSITIEQIRSTTLAWSLQGWTPDLIVIDYADILAPISGHAETRDQINETWKRMRRMSQELHCCVVTATQADAASYSAERLDMTNFSEDKRKFAHVTAMIGINQKEKEKSDQVQRLNYLVLRDSEFTSEKTVFIGNALKIAHPTVCSSF